MRSAIHLLRKGRLEDTRGLDTAVAIEHYKQAKSIIAPLAQADSRLPDMEQPTYAQNVLEFLNTRLAALGG